jgi:glycosyltransferase involved in cell wall biosynthesis
MTVETAGERANDRGGQLSLEDLLRRCGCEGPPQGIFQLASRLEQSRGANAAEAAMRRLQVALGYRRLSVGIYDHALHVVGGGQKYVATLAAQLQDRFDVTYLANHPIGLDQLREWYGLDLSRCSLRIVPLPFYGRRQWIDSGLVTRESENPFDLVARASADYDVFVNANMLEKVRPLAPLSLFVCHFPDVMPRAYFAAHEYTLLIANSRYTSAWLRRRWGLEASMLLYPPIDVAGDRVPKDRVILSVARFEPGGSKKQREMIAAFVALKRAFPDLLQGWRLVLVGGALTRNGYLERVRRDASGHPASIEIRVNAPLSEVRECYAGASIFWHACGVCELDPQLVEHFGMTTVEAMQNGCVPVVFDGGGQREIVTDGVDGFRFRELDELCIRTVDLIRNEALRTSMQERARESSRRFARPVFESRVRRLFDMIHREYATIDLELIEETMPATVAPSTARR